MDALTALRTDLDRAMTRIRLLEEVVFQLQNKQTQDALESVEAIRGFLRKVGNIADIPTPAATFLRERLPMDWRDLIARHGYQVVFPLLARDFNIVDARRALR